MEINISAAEWLALLVFTASSLASLWMLWLRNVVYPPKKVTRHDGNKLIRHKRDADTKINGGVFLVIAVCSVVLIVMGATTNEVMREEFSNMENVMVDLVSQEDFDKLMDRVEKIEKILGRPPDDGTGAVMEKIQEITDRLEAINEKFGRLDDKFVAKPEFEELREIVAMLNNVVKRQAQGNTQTR